MIHSNICLETRLTQIHASVTWSKVRQSDIFEIPAWKKNMSTNSIPSSLNFWWEDMGNLKCLTAWQIFHTKGVADARGTIWCQFYENLSNFNFWPLLYKFQIYLWPVLTHNSPNVGHMDKNVILQWSLGPSEQFDILVSKIEACLIFDPCTLLWVWQPSWKYAN